jgi:hypothetical protein
VGAPDFVHQRVARLRINGDVANPLEFDDQLQAFRPKRARAVKRVQDDSLNQIAQRHIVTLR